MLHNCKSTNKCIYIPRQVFPIKLTLIQLSYHHISLLPVLMPLISSWYSLFRALSDSMWIVHTSDLPVCVSVDTNSSSYNTQALLCHRIHNQLSGINGVSATEFSIILFVGIFIGYATKCANKTWLLQAQSVVVDTKSICYKTTQALATLWWALC